MAATDHFATEHKMDLVTGISLNLTCCDQSLRLEAVDPFSAYKEDTQYITGCLRDVKALIDYSMAGTRLAFVLNRRIHLVPCMRPRHSPLTSFRGYRLKRDRRSHALHGHGLRSKINAFHHFQKHEHIHSLEHTLLTTLYSFTAAIGSGTKLWTSPIVPTTVPTYP
ncbi:hypothetical protein RRG08_062752 [Elysia crispata]|uniref:Uncharacterized protein n=1 Tax=Elysia crispata TaxID=231223 RepID=A0AAE0YLI2_9GAST|nr:hypothetical protein RRG08_062752 [Elysia crispata]